jgi:polar amino acid transport system permease protein
MTYNFYFGVIWANAGLLVYGLGLGLALALGALAVGTAIGLVCAFLANGRGSVAKVVVASYVSVIRNLPLLVIVLFAYFALPRIGIRMGKMESFGASLAIYAGAYLTEVFRAGLAGVPRGVIDAGRAIGLAPVRLAIFVILPILVRNVLPALGTTFISLFKDTSIAATIAIPELTYQARKINVETFRVAEAWLAASSLYIATCLALAALLRWAETRFPKY